MNILSLNILSFLIVFIGAGIGGALRLGVNMLASQMVQVHFPIATFFVNTLGSFFIGAFYGFPPIANSHWPKLLLTSGVLGGFTTFSAFSLEIFTLLEHGELPLALFYMISSVAVSLIALAVGVSLMRALSG